MRPASFIFNTRPTPLARNGNAQQGRLAIAGLSNQPQPSGDPTLRGAFTLPARAYTTQRDDARGGSSCPDCGCSGAHFCVGRPMPDLGAIRNYPAENNV